MRLRFTPEALTELEEVLGYIAERSPEGARRVQSRIQAITLLLAERPHIGRLTSLSRVRRVSVVPYPYLIFYEFQSDEVVVLAIRHARRHPDSFPGKEPP